MNIIDIIYNNLQNHICKIPNYSSIIDKNHNLIKILNKINLLLDYDFRLNNETTIQLILNNPIIISLNNPIILLQTKTIYFNYSIINIIKNNNFKIITINKNLILFSDTDDYIEYYFKIIFNNKSNNIFNIFESIQYNISENNLIDYKNNLYLLKEFNIFVDIQIDTIVSRPILILKIISFIIETNGISIDSNIIKILNQIEKMLFIDKQISDIFIDNLSFGNFENNLNISELTLFFYTLEDKKILDIFIKYLNKYYSKLIKIIFEQVFIDELLNIFNVNTFRNLFLLYGFQNNLFININIYNKKNYFENNNINNDENLLDYVNLTYNSNMCNFINMKKIANLELSLLSRDNNLKESIKDKYDDNIYIDKNKLRNLKKLKKFTIIIANLDLIFNKLNIKNDDIIYIKNLYHLLLILFTKLKHNSKYYDLRIAICLKKFLIFGNKFLIIGIEIFNQILQEYNSDIKYQIDINYLNKILSNNTIINYINNKMLEIPIVYKKYICKEDNINIINYQDAFIILLELIYKNKSIIEIDLNQFQCDLFNAILSDMRSNILIKSKLSIELIDKKHKHKSKYKISHNKILDKIFDIDEYN